MIICEIFPSATSRAIIPRFGVLMASDSEHLSAAAALLNSRRSVTVLSAMSPCQPDELIGALLTEGRRLGVAMRLLIADLTGRWAFLSDEDEADLRSGRLRLVSLAGVVPKRLSSHIDFYPHSLYDVDRYLADGTLAADLFVARVNQLNPGVGFTLGDMVGYTPTALKRIERVGFEVRPGLGSVSRLTAVDRDRPTVVCTAAIPERVEPKKPAPTAEHNRIGKLVAGLLPDDATVQLGIGTAAQAVLPHLTGKKGLGLHSGILPASVQALITAGVFTGAAKTDRPRLHTATGVLSSSGQTWDDSIRLEQISVTHSPEVLRRQHRLWAINSAFEVDLLGQVNAEYASGVRVASGGGQTDFFRAAHLSDSGAAVLVLPARTTSGRPRIVPALQPPHYVTSTAGDLDYVVTEFGVAQLTGATASERANRLIAISHPDDRATLTRASGEARD
jgi:4-hydroxybutyrate CoA-transferase